MKKLEDLALPQHIGDALRLVRRRLNAEFNVDRIVLFGSIVRGAADEESDVDLLVLLKEPPDHSVRDRISSIILDVNLEYGTNLSELIVDRENWDHGIPSALPIHQIIGEEGIRL